ncbi:MAG: YceI family protein [Prolixibacteraceae bacterium]|jgi:polyisoprenoid-binding protein YceI|nr:YceI family protein [Prolixibacteraceae bacterium]
MKKIIKTMKISALSALFVIISQVIYAQVQYKLDAKNSSMVIKGTSTIHDWEMKVGEMKSAFSLSSGNIFEDKLTGGDFLVNVESIKSEHSLMNKKTYEALKKEKFPQIRAKVIKAEQSPNSGKVQVELSIAGKTKLVEEDIHLKDLGNGRVEMKGSLDLKMSEYGIEPPVALMGSIKTGDEVKIEFNLVYSREGQLLGEAGRNK